jgi:hypothetical protein
MPRASARPLRSGGVLRIVAVGIALALAACSGGGGGGGATGGTATSSPAPSVTGQTTGVTLAWNSANGPVAGYSVYVQRGQSDFKHEADVSQIGARVFGTPGGRARVIVVAFDAAGVHGPMSPTSAQFAFPSANANSQASAPNAGFVGTVAATLPVQAQQAVAAASAVSGFESSAASEDAAGDDPAAPSSDEEAATPDLPGGALVWQSGDAFRLTNAAVETTRLFARPEAAAQLAAVADFDADGHGDLLWAGTSGALFYTPGRGLRSADPVSPVLLGILGANARVLGAGDFDGDGAGDVLVERAGAVFARLTRSATPDVADLGSSAGAALAGIADFDANGSDDVAWRTADALVIWRVDAGRAIETVTIDLALDFDVLAIGDFDGEGAAEVATRDPSGSVFVVHPFAETLAFEPTDLANAQGWTGVGAVDLELDRSEEVVLASADGIRVSGMPGDQVVALDPASPWRLVALLP